MHHTYIINSYILHMRILNRHRFQTLPSQILPINEVGPKLISSAGRKCLKTVTNICMRNLEHVVPDWVGLLWAYIPVFYSLYSRSIIVGSTADKKCQRSCSLFGFLSVSNQCRSSSPFALMPSWMPPKHTISNLRDERIKPPHCDFGLAQTTYRWNQGHNFGY